MGAGARAYDLAELREQTRAVDDAAPSALVPGATVKEMAWSPDETSRDFLGNEFLLWLWHEADTRSSTVETEAGEVTIYIDKSLDLDCAYGQTGKDTLRGDGP